MELKVWLREAVRDDERLEIEVSVIVLQEHTVIVGELLIDEHGDTLPLNVPDPEKEDE